MTQTTFNRRQALAAGSALAVSMAGAAFAQEQKKQDPREDALPVPGAVRSQFDKKSTAEQVTEGLDLTGKTVLITGCNSGLGFETMRVMMLRGAHVLGLARSKDKAAEAIASVAAMPGVKGKGTPFACELQDFATVAAAADEVNKLEMPIDVLMTNAGIMALQKPEQVNGIEKHFVVNHLGHFILVNRLMEKVKAAPQGRFVVVSSMGYRWAPEAGIEFDNLDGTRDYTPNKMYGQSKLANGLMSLELAKRLAGTATTSNAIHPGVINTNLGRHFPWYVRVAASLIGWTFMKTVEEGAATQSYVATAPALSTTSGLYFEDCNPVIPQTKAMQDPDLAAKLWAKSEELTKPYLPVAVV
ncbi:MAG: SDR family NAD(P)-dependent oxidoreductase [Rhodospirillaceae bacterium]|nr:SDR family NAD(P)-dependent oxidoreductase [Rhodospirillaceae bacterium]